MQDVGCWAGVLASEIPHRQNARGPRLEIWGVPANLIDLAFEHSSRPAHDSDVIVV
ncbi:hypothetical protein [Paracoccus beibuensis]|uniref:hypothetical protein n=1 Tax=Paracoccus beibuensis TaxID=547602 RepID=UPI00223FC5FC|nr:hypothetical protein [Paracoccus beibuensis]